MPDKFSLKKALEEIQEDEKDVRSSTRHLTQEDIKKMLAAKRKPRKTDAGDHQPKES